MKIDSFWEATATFVFPLLLLLDIHFNSNSNSNAKSRWCNITMCYFIYLFFIFQNEIANRLQLIPSP